MIAGPLTGQKTDHYTGAFSASQRGSLGASMGDMMRRVSSRASVGVLIAALGVLAAGCSQVGLLKGKMAFKDANTAYQQQDYRVAAEKYEETLAACRGSEAACSEPRLVAAYFFLGNSYDNQYRPA